jgi:Holliday junction resolvase RusA-like endonuclease
LKRFRSYAGRGKSNQRNEVASGRYPKRRSWHAGKKSEQDSTGDPELMCAKPGENPSRISQLTELAISMAAERSYTPAPVSTDTKVQQRVINFFVAGLPRPHQHRQTRFGVMYLTTHAKNWQKTVTWAAIAACGKSWKVYIGPVSMNLEFRFPLAKSNKLDKPGDPHLQDPDLTNLLKCAEDGLKRTIFADDCMVWRVMPSKIWCKPGDEGLQVGVYLG